MDDISNKCEAPTIRAPVEKPNIIEYEIDKETKLKFEFKDKIINFNVTQVSLVAKYYELIITLDQLSKINKVFSNFENTNDLINWIINSLKQKKKIAGTYGGYLWLIQSGYAILFMREEMMPACLVT